MYADENGLWSNNKATVGFSEPVGLLSWDQRMTSWVRVTRNKYGQIHAWPVTDPN